MKTGMELKKEIMKATGLKARELSVTYDGSYNVKVKVAYPLSKVKDIAKKNEKIDRDESGEILCGGNTFVFVDYDWQMPGLTVEAKASILAASQEARASINVTCGDENYWMGERMAKMAAFTGWQPMDCRCLVAALR